MLRNNSVWPRAHAGVAEFGLADIFDPPAELLGDRLHAVADAEDRQTELEQALGNLGLFGLQRRFRPAGEDEPARAESTNLLEIGVPGIDLGIDPGFAHATRDQLRVLRAEIQDEDFIFVNV